MVAAAMSSPSPEQGALAIPSLKRSLIATALCALAYLYVFPYTPSLNNPNENVRLYMTAAMVEEGSYEINTLRKRWGWVNDAAKKDDKLYSVKAPGTSWLGVPGYALYYAVTDTEELELETALWTSRVTGTILPTLIFLFFFYIWLGRQTLSPFARDAVFLSVALGSSFYGYTLLFASHTTSAICAFGGFMLLYDARRSQDISPHKAFLAGLLVAGITFFEYPGFILSAFLSLFALVAIRPWKRLVFFAIGGLIPTLLVMQFQGSAFGDPFSPGHLYVENTAFREGHEEGFFGATHLRSEAVWGLLFDFRLGMLTMTPLFLLAFYGFGRLLFQARERLDAGVVITMSLVMFLFICSFNIWHAGWSIGPRYLTALLPFMGWAALHGMAPPLERFPTAARVAFTGLVLAGLVASGIPSAYYPHLPESIDQPLGELFRVLIAHGYSPPNAGNLLGVYGNLSMLPLVLVGIAAVVGGLLGDLPRRKRALVFAGGTLVALLLLFPQMFRSQPQEPEARKFVKHVTTHWYPPGHDRATQLERSIAAGREDTPGVFLDLANIYHLEGRDEDAERAIERGFRDLRGP